MKLPEICRDCYHLRDDGGFYRCSELDLWVDELKSPEENECPLIDDLDEEKKE